ncbi:hypothetical protein HMPREF1992_01463 [Selenomonas sp. oral taxon 892 str. F0426]|nr:hypothetical protein HMPREF1992_01463 [Selenomonas sp. oral taxon 892 str. F0426]
MIRTRDCCTKRNVLCSGLFFDLARPSFEKMPSYIGTHFILCYNG